MATFAVTLKAAPLKEMISMNHLSVVFEGPDLAPTDPSEYSSGVFDSMGNRVGYWTVEGRVVTEYFDGQMPENKKPDLQWMTGEGVPYRHLVAERHGHPVALCGSRANVLTPDVRRRDCPRCLSIVTNNISSVTVAVAGGYNYLPEEEEPMVERIPKRPLLQNPHEEPQTYTLAQVLLIRDYLTPFMRTKSGYSTDPDEKALDELLRAGAFDTDRVLILAAEAEQEKARKAAEREAAKRSSKAPKKNSEPSAEELSAMLDVKG